MSFTVSLQKRIQQLKKINADVPKVMCKVAEGATMRAVETAKAATPPKEGTGRGPYIGKNMITGDLQGSWDEYSKTTPVIRGNTVVTELNNNMPYASYVDQGHRLERHFVPGLYIDKNGLLARRTDGKKGLVVGTKTKFVKGEFMVDKAKAEYESVVLFEMDKEIQRLMK